MLLIRLRRRFPKPQNFKKQCACLVPLVADKATVVHSLETPWLLTRKTAPPTKGHRNGVGDQQWKQVNHALNLGRKPSAVALIAGQIDSSTLRHGPTPPIVIQLAQTENYFTRLAFVHEKELARLRFSKSFAAIHEVQHVSTFLRPVPASVMGSYRALLTALRVYLRQQLAHFDCSYAVPTPSWRRRRFPYFRRQKVVTGGSRRSQSKASQTHPPTFRHPPKDRTDSDRIR